VPRVIALGSTRSIREEEHEKSAARNRAPRRLIDSSATLRSLRGSYAVDICEMSGRPRCRPAAEYRANEARFSRGRGPLGRDRYCTPLAFRDSRTCSAPVAARRGNSRGRATSLTRSRCTLVSVLSENRTRAPSFPEYDTATIRECPPNRSDFLIDAPIRRGELRVAEDPPHPVDSKSGEARQCQARHRRAERARRNRYRISGASASSFTRDYQFTSAARIAATRAIARRRSQSPIGQLTKD